MATINYHSWHHNIVEKYTNKSAYDGISFCQYTRLVLRGIMKIWRIIALASFLLMPFALGLPLLLTGYFHHLEDIKQFYRLYVNMDVPSGNVFYDFMLALSIFIDLILSAIVFCCGIAYVIITVVFAISITFYSIIVQYFKPDDSESPESTSLIVQWIKFKYQKLCPIITIKYD